MKMSWGKNTSNTSGSGKVGVPGSSFKIPVDQPMKKG